MRTASPDTPCPSNGTAYLMAYNAVLAAPGLIRGRLNGPHGEHCAIGWVFANKTAPLALKFDFVDEVAMVNDSVPASASPKQRRLVVLRWLRWKLQQAGMAMPGRPSRRPR
jgi:hypothetical protein